MWPVFRIWIGATGRYWSLSFKFIQKMQQTIIVDDGDAGGVGAACPCLRNEGWPELFIKFEAVSVIIPDQFRRGSVFF